LKPSTISLESYVFFLQSYSVVVFHYKSFKSAFESSEKNPQMQKSSIPNEMFSTGGKNGKGNADENLNFIKEEIIPGMTFSLRDY
jgi:hypothetical protein